MEVRHTNVLSRNLKEYQNEAVRYVVNQGGSRSSKTYSILQLLIIIALTKPKTTISIVRQTFPALKGSVIRDLIEILKEMNIYQQALHHKTESKYQFPNGSFIEWFPTVDDQKLRGRKRDILYCNEANEISFSEFNQLVLRTTGKVFLDFNPSDTEHWIYDLLKDEARTVLIKSTYLDNPFLGQDQIEYIQNLINVDTEYYKVYALGERPIAQTRIYSHFKQFNELPEPEDWCYGLDFGFNHPSALVKCSFRDGRVYIEELLYKTGLTVDELISKVRALVPDRKSIWCDSARPDIIEGLRRAGLVAREANKSVKEGINEVKSKEVFLDINAENCWKEYRLYSWRTYREQILDEPVKEKDDAMDAIRYAIYSEKKGKFDKRYIGIHSSRLK